MMRIIHKETGKVLVISDSHGLALTQGRHPEYRVDDNFDPEANAKAQEAAFKAKRDAEMAAAAEEEEAAKVAIEKEDKSAPVKRSAKVK